MTWMVKKSDGSVREYEREKIQLVLANIGITDIHITELCESELYSDFFSDGSIPSTSTIKRRLVTLLEKYGYVAAAENLKENIIAPDDQISPFVENLVEEYLFRSDWRVNENSNMNYSLQGLNFHVSSSIVARYWLNKMYPSYIGDAHTDGDIHIHDLGVLGPYCVGWDLQDLILRGFGGVPGKIESSPAKHFRTILGQIVNFFYTLQGEAAGAQAFSNFDTLLAPFVRFDGLGYFEVKQALQEFVFNLNVPTRVGFQAPFTNITLDLTPSPALENTPVIIGGEILEDHTYGMFQEEMNLINRALAELMAEGDAKGRIFTFPIPTYNIHRNFDFDDPELIPLWEMTGKYGIPYFSNFVNSDLDPDDVRSMCCRLRLDTKELRNRGGGLFGANPQTGSIGVVTVNIPRIAHLASSQKDFYRRLNDILEIARESLEIKRGAIEELTDRGLFPYTTNYLHNVKDRFGCWWANHFSTIGIIGMNEACENLLGCPISDPIGKQWAVEVMDYLRNQLARFQEETGNFYNLEATPAEGASYRLARKDAKLFDGIFAQGSEDVPYYTNSVHVPAMEQMDIFELLEHQDELQTMFTGGTVVHLFLGEAIPDPSSVKELVRSIVQRFRLPYFSITPTFSICPVHGYISGKHFRCPYPHSDSELADFGKDVEISESEIRNLDSTAYRNIELKEGRK
ncbi:ribonucleoside triphosphate reductase [Myxococcota bacterium]|nr:ribonucleoside triphosphate reductase [Myxococcota bacterium]MBU1381806.1 ribonucleoside triphosphate reductase [Myxococcota bacterium]MBU1498583.1 ribonucleoside triphosphate reductase [Myxococcota bacterium]